MKRCIPLLLLFVVFLASCKKDKPNPTPVTPIDTDTIPSSTVVNTPEFIKNLLFVTNNSYQIVTKDEAASFSSTDTHLKMSSSGLITRLTCAEVVPIVIKWKDTSKPNTTIYALGATTTDQDYPFINYQGAPATDVLGSYVMGWKTLQKLPITGETYAIVLRHADASNGEDFTKVHNYPGPADWWESTDSTLARQLNAQGLERAPVLGQVLKDLKFPIKRIITSQFYRARQTAELMNIGPAFTTDARINHPSYNLYGPGIYQGMRAVISEQPIDNNMTLIIAHHPINELNPTTGYPSFPTVSPFNWTGAYLIKIETNGGITYEGAVSWGMFKYWRDLKLKKL